MLRFPGVNEEALRNLVRLSHTVPCYHLELGPDLTRIPEVIRQLLASRVPAA
jgi:hypothetical protein